jgi:hypothetical protein
MATEEGDSRSLGLTTAQATVAGAVIALVSGVAGALIAARSTERIAAENAAASIAIENTKQSAAADIARKSFESSLIFEAIKAPTRADAIRNLRFFVAAGFLTDSGGRIANLKDEEFPSQSNPSPTSVTKAVRSTGVATFIDKDGRTLSCTAAAISRHQAVTRSECATAPVAVSDTYMTLGFGGSLYRPKALVLDNNKEVALVGIAVPDQFAEFLDRSRVREPIPGESIYFAHLSAGPSAIEMTVCSVVSNDSMSADFVHNCQAGPGSAGAIIIAVSDDALLGVHQAYDAVAGMGRAAKLSKVLPQFAAYLEP